MTAAAAIKLASVEHRKAEFVVTSYTQTPPGFWRMNGRFSRVASDCAPEVLGKTVRDALEASNTIDLHDIDASADSFAPVLTALGLKNYVQYMKGTRSVSVEIGEDGALRVTPMRNGGTCEGFVELLDEATVIDDRSDESLGSAVRDAMARARP